MVELHGDVVKIIAKEDLVMSVLVDQLEVSSAIRELSCDFDLRLCCP